MYKQKYHFHMFWHWFVHYCVIANNDVVMQLKLDFKTLPTMYLYILHSNIRKIIVFKKQL